MTSQMEANLQLAQWQALRALPPEERIEELMRTFFRPPLDLDIRYQDQLNAVSAVMEDA